MYFYLDLFFVYLYELSTCIPTIQLFLVPRFKLITLCLTKINKIIKLINYRYNQAKPTTQLIM